MSRRQGRGAEDWIVLEDRGYKIVNNFKYLGSLLTENNTVAEE